jgi:hypothetical protein
MREFVKVDRNQMLLLPPSVDELLPADHLARFVVEVVEQLDLSAIIARNSRSTKDYAPYLRGTTPHDGTAYYPNADGPRVHPNARWH